MIRAARMMDVFRLVELLEYAQARSTYAGDVAVDPLYARKFIGRLIMKHGSLNDGGSFCMVAEDSDGTVQAFMAGALDRVHQVGDLLQANDVFLVATHFAPKGATLTLVDAYVDWAVNNPKVYQIFGSRIDALPGSDRLDGVFKRRGFANCGAIFRRVNKPAEQREAA